MLHQETHDRYPPNIPRGFLCIFILYICIYVPFGQLWHCTRIKSLGLKSSHKSPRNWVCLKMYENKPTPMFNLDMFQQSGHFAGIYGILQCSYCIDIYTHTHIVYTVHIYIYPTILQCSSISCLVLYPLVCWLKE